MMKTNGKMELEKGIQELIDKLEAYEDLKRTVSVMRAKLDMPCIDHTCNGLEAREYNISRGGLVASLLGYYRELLEKETNDFKQKPISL